MLINAPKHLAMFARSRRKKLGMTQTEVAQRVHLKQKTVSMFENAPENIRLSTVMSILASLELEVKITPKEDAGDSGWREAW